MIRLLIVISLLSGTTAAFAQPVPLAGDGLKALAGSRVELDTPLGTKLPILFGNDGLVSAEAGDLAPILGSAKDRGRWWVDGDKLCSKWFRWFDAEVRCITVAREGTRLYWKKDDGETGTATLVEAPKTETPKKQEQVAATPAPEVVPVATVTSLPPDEGIPVPLKKKSLEHVEKPAPVVVARADVSSSALPGAHDFSGEPMMRFGGAALLEASARMGVERGAAVVPAQDPAKISKAASRTIPAAAALPAAAHEPVAETSAPAQKRSLAAANVPAAQRKAAASIKKVVRNAPRQTPASVQPEVVSPPLYRVRGVDDDDVLNVRRGPAEEHDLVATIPSTGRRVEMTGTCQKDWCPIRYGRARGWVHRYYLTEEHPRQASSSAVYFSEP